MRNAPGSPSRRSRRRTNTYVDHRINRQAPAPARIPPPPFVSLYLRRPRFGPPILQVEINPYDETSACNKAPLSIDEKRRRCVPCPYPAITPGHRLHPSPSPDHHRFIHHRVTLRARLLPVLPAARGAGTRPSSRRARAAWSPASRTPAASVGALRRGSLTPWWWWSTSTTRSIIKHREQRQQQQQHQQQQQQQQHPSQRPRHRPRCPRPRRRRRRGQRRSAGGSCPLTRRRGRACGSGAASPTSASSRAFFFVVALPLSSRARACLSSCVAFVLLANCVLTLRLLLC